MSEADGDAVDFGSAECSNSIFWVAAARISPHRSLPVFARPPAAKSSCFSARMPGNPVTHRNGANPQRPRVNLKS